MGAGNTSSQVTPGGRAAARSTISATRLLRLELLYFFQSTGGFVDLVMEVTVRVSPSFLAVVSSAVAIPLITACTDVHPREATSTATAETTGPMIDWIGETEFTPVYLDADSATPSASAATSETVSNTVLASETPAK